MLFYFNILLMGVFVVALLTGVIVVRPWPEFVEMWKRIFDHIFPPLD